MGKKTVDRESRLGDTQIFLTRLSRHRSSAIELTSVELLNVTSCDNSCGECYYKLVAKKKRRYGA